MPQRTKIFFIPGWTTEDSLRLHDDEIIPYKFNATTGENRKGADFRALELNLQSKHCGANRKSMVADVRPIRAGLNFVEHPRTVKIAPINDAGTIILDDSVRASGTNEEQVPPEEKVGSLC